MEKEIKEALAKVELLHRDGNLKAAYEGCIEILKYDPENIKAIRFLKKIQEEIQNTQLNSIRDNIKKLEPLWGQKRYEELLQNYKKLYELAPHYEPLEKLLAEASEKLRGKLTEQKKNFVKNYQSELEKMFAEGKFQDLILKSSQTEAAYPSNAKIKEIGLDIRIKVVKKELERNKPLLKSENYAGIIGFLKQLKTTEPTYKKIDALVRKYQKKGLFNLTDKQREFVYRGLSNIETLMQLRKYDKAVIVAREVLEVDPINKKAQTMLRISEKKEKGRIQKEILLEIKKYFAEAKKDYIKNKKNFIRV